MEDATNSLGPSANRPQEAQISIQTELFHVEKQIEYDGIEMGVLGNGIPYLSERGLARLCGINRTVLNRLAVNWNSERSKDRGSAIDNILRSVGYNHYELYLRSELNGVVVNAYTEPVCMAILEYYAFISDEKRDEALDAYRKLARLSFRTFIYRAVGYSPEQQLLKSWKHFHDRVDMTLTSVPVGYFGVFREIAAIIVPMIRAGVIINDRVVPDISAGKAWSKHWQENQFDEKFGGRIRYDHEYPLYYPQSKSNPQPSFAYPDAALGEFRRWLSQIYITSKLPSYLLRQYKGGKLPQASAAKALEAFSVRSTLSTNSQKSI
jgi:hypothetical protein